VIGPATCPNGGAGLQVGTIPDAGPGYILNRNGQSCYGRDGQGRDIVLQTDFAASGRRYDTPAVPAVGHPAFGNFGGSVSFFAPAAGLLRAVDIAANEYQGGQDFSAAWETTSGQFRPGFPAPVNDLQFVTGPSIADVDGSSQEEVVAGTSSLDLTALSPAGTPINPSWPRLTSDWIVANPLIGSFGTLDTQTQVHKRVVAMTRSGSILAYFAQAHPCSPGSWPRFHHDNANSGNFRRDAVAPGKPMAVTVSGGNLTFRAPGDDLLCGRADHYRVVTSDQPITGANFNQKQTVPGAPDPGPPGTTQSVPLPPDVKRFVGIRAVDEYGNIGPAAVVTTTP
jgi:hypothetical protein